MNYDNSAPTTFHHFSVYLGYTFIMRLQFWVVFAILANVFFWGWGYLQSGSLQREPERIAAQIQPQNLTIVKSRSDVEALPPPDTSRVPLQSQVSADAPPIKLLPAPPPAKAATKTVNDNKNNPQSVCLKIIDLTTNEANVWSKALPAAEKEKVYLWELQTPASATKEKAAALAAQLKKEKKMRMAIPSSRAPWVVTIGRFSEQKDAEAALKRITNNNVKANVLKLSSGRFNLIFRNLKKGDENVITKRADNAGKNYLTC